MKNNHGQHSKRRKVCGKVFGFRWEFSVSSWRYSASVLGLVWVRVLAIYIWTRDMPGDDETHFGMKLTPGVNQSNEWRDRCRLSMSS